MTFDSSKLSVKVGDLHPVWWETFDGRPAGDHLARILEIKPYHGPLDFVECILVLEAPTLRGGKTEMSLTRNNR